MIAALFAALALTSVDTDFDAFRRDFRAEAVAAGVAPELYDREMATAKPLTIVFERDANQPEFVRPIWDYLSSAASERRVADGRAAASEHNAPLTMASQAYGVDKGILAAIWGLESSYGRILGEHDILSATATLGYKGRRQSFGRRELLAALTILDEGYAKRDELRGSWAGAMGMTQFIPSTYLAYAVDQDGDGRRDLWTDHGDVFASTANYLDRAGWQTAQPVYVEVSVPQTFDYALADGRKLRVVDWIRLGVRGTGGVLGDSVDLDLAAKLLLPAGANGPKFLTFRNFDVIKRYNNATSYALGVAMLSRGIKGEDAALAAAWPTQDRPLTKTEREELQQLLTDKGYALGKVDGMIGPNTRKALRAWQVTQGLPADGYASAKMLERLKGS